MVYFFTLKLHNKRNEVKTLAYQSSSSWNKIIISWRNMAFCCHCFLLFQVHNFFYLNIKISKLISGPLLVLKYKYWFADYKQESILVWCIPPAAVAISPAMHTSCHACPLPCMPPVM